MIVEKPRVYIETSMVSYLTARPSRDVIAAAHQQLSIQWRENRKGSFDLVTSLLVVEEASRGNPEAAGRRLSVLEDIPHLELTTDARALANEIIRGGLLPDSAFPDALHIAMATAHQVDYLLTWNCTHIANAEILPKVATICEGRGLALSYICTPEELLGDPQ